MAGNDNYNNVTSNQLSITAQKANQTITINPASITSKTYGDAAFSMSATSTSGLTVSLSSATGSVCTYSSGLVTILHAGTCTIGASQAGDDNYNSATASSTGTIAKKTLTVTAPNVTRVLNQPLGTVDTTPTYAGFVAGENSTVIDTPPTCGFASGASTATFGSFADMVVCSGGLDRDYDFTFVTGSLIVDYKYSQFLQPINADGSSNFKLGSTIPVKFQLLDYYNVVQDAPWLTFAIKVTQVRGTPSGTVNEVASGASADYTQFFRWDSTNKLYIYNLSTKNSGMSEGGWKVEALKAGSPVVTGTFDIRK